MPNQHVKGLAMEIKCPHCRQRNRVPVEKLGQSVNCGKCHDPLLNAPVDVDAASLKELIASSAVPVLVDFWAPWCGPCRMFAPTFKSAAGKFGGSVVFAKLDTEAHPSVGQQFNIRSIPTLAAFLHGEELGRVSGALPAGELEKLVLQLQAGKM